MGLGVGEEVGAVLASEVLTSSACVWHGMVWYGMVCYGIVWYGMAWYSMVWLASEVLTSSSCAFCLPAFQQYICKRNADLSVRITAVMRLVSVRITAMVRLAGLFTKPLDFQFRGDPWLWVLLAGVGLRVWAWVGHGSKPLC